MKTVNSAVGRLRGCIVIEFYENSCKFQFLLNW